jgi:hypothetical protein
MSPPSDSAPGEPAGARWRQPPPAGWWSAAAAAGAVAALHFTLLLAWLVPGEVLPAAARGLAAVYVEPVFAQNWWLFAPDPPAVARGVDVRGVTFVDGASRHTPWVSVTRPLATVVRRNPLSPHNARRIVVLNATYAVTDPGGPMRLRGAARELVLRAWSDPARQPAAVVVLERAGAVELAATYPGRHFDQLQIRVTARPLPPPKAGAGRGADAAPGPPDVLLFAAVPFPSDLHGGAPR